MIELSPAPSTTDERKAPAVLSLIGDTPLVEITRIDTGPCQLFVKLENQNPTGSIKDRVALAMIEAAERGGQNLFAGNGYAGLSDFALYYIGGVIKHARALNAITNPGTNSYKRLVPGFEAPINLAYSAKNRSASCRIPHVASPKGRRVEVRFPDPTANPYLAFAALLMAGLDGVQNKIHPGDPIDKNLYDLPPEEAAKVPHPCHSLDQALESLEADHAFLTKGGVFSEDMISAYIELKMEEVTRFRMTTHPVEFDMYYSS